MSTNKKKWVKQISEAKFFRTLEQNFSDCMILDSKYSETSPTYNYFVKKATLSSYKTYLESGQQYPLAIRDCFFYHGGFIYSRVTRFEWPRLDKLRVMYSRMKVNPVQAYVVDEMYHEGNAEL